MKPTIETINGRLCTVTRRPFDADWVREQLLMGMPVLAEDDGDRCTLRSVEERDAGGDIFWCDDRSPIACGGEYEFDCTVTILPALHRFPTHEDAPLILRYMAEGLHPMTGGGLIMVDLSEETNQHVIGVSDWDGALNQNEELEIMFCYCNGERVEIAIVDNKPEEGAKND